MEYLRLKDSGILSVSLFATATGMARGAAHHVAMHRAAAAQPQNDGASITGFCIWGAILIATYYTAKAKQRNPAGWVVAAMFTLFLPMLVLLLISRGNYVTPARRSKEQQAEHQRAIAQKLAAIESGRLTPFIPQGVMPQAGEQFFWEQRCQYGQMHKQTIHRGANPALYVPLGHGMKVRVGGYQGASQYATNFSWGPLGTVYLSNLRLLFKADTSEVANAPFTKIITYDAYPDGLSLNVSGIGVMQFKTGDACLGSAFLKVIQAPPKAELTT